MYPVGRPPSAAHGTGNLNLDIVSLQIVAAVSNFLAGALHLIPGLTRRDRGGWARVWGWSKILVGAANALTLLFDGSNIDLLERLLNLGLIVGLALSMHSIAIFGGKSPPRILTAMIGAAMLVLVALMVIETTDVRWSVAALGTARVLCLFGMTWLILGIARRESLLTAWIMGGLFAATVPLFLLHALFNLLAFTLPAWERTAQMAAYWVVGIAIILVTLTHFSLLLIEAERTQRELRDLACRDGLTGALNRFGLEQIEATLRGEVALLLIDIDHFKALNDLQGHAAGDMVLRLLADLALGALGDRGQVVRIGGDEFLCLLPGGSGAEAEALRQRLSHRFDRAVIGAVDTPHPPTLSIGIATGPVGDGLDRLIHAADEAMYAVKRRHHRQRSRPAAA